MKNRNNIFEYAFWRSYDSKKSIAFDFNYSNLFTEAEKLEKRVLENFIAVKTYQDNYGLYPNFPSYIERISINYLTYTPSKTIVKS